MSSRTTIISVTYNSAQVLPEMLQSLPSDSPVIVVDNNSNDETVELLRDRPGVRVIENAQNVGFGRASNMGAQGADTEFLLFLNPDARLEPEAVDALERGADARPELGAANPMVVDTQGRARLKMSSVLDLPDIPKPSIDEAGRMPVLSGVALFVPRAVFEAVGGFDPSIFLYHEDHELCDRITKAGYELWHLPDAVATHLRGCSSPKKVDNAYWKGFQMARSRYYVMEKAKQGEGFRGTFWPALIGSASPLTLVSKRRRAKYRGQLSGALSARKDGGKFMCGPRNGAGLSKREERRTDKFGDLQTPERVSLFVMAYNQQEFVEDTIRAAFAQTYRPLEIVLSDDGSTDNTYEIMERLAAEYSGPHEVRLNRNQRNLGFVGHLNLAFEICRGALIVYNPGDDISEPRRVEKLYEAFREDRPLLVHSDAYNMNPDGSLNGIISSRQADIDAMNLEETARALSLGIGATCGWNPDLYRIFGPIEQPATYDDLIFFFRARLLDRIAHVPEPLVRYRYQVGISNRFERDWRLRIRHELKLLRLADATYRQRIADCMNVAPERTDIIKTLEAGIAKVAFKRRLYATPFKALPECLLSPQKFEAALSVLNRVRKLTLNARRESQKSAGLVSSSRSSARIRSRGTPQHPSSSPLASVRSHGNS